jgi:hypothetical protein
MALYVNPIPWNVFNDNVTLEQKTDLQSRIRSELPAFIHYLLHEFTPSLDLIGQSFQCKEFIHPKIEKLNRENTREGKFRLFLKDLLGNEKFFGQPIELHNRIVAECGFDSIKHIYQGPVGLGKLLAKLCKIHGDEFTGGKSGIDRKYRYTIQFNDNDLLQDGEGL